MEGSGGGSGKTTLACHLAHEAMARSGYPLLPVVMTKNWRPSSPLDEVIALCTTGSRSWTPPMVRNLASRGRILLIVDGLSEMGGDLNGDRIWFRSLIVTARRRPPDEGEPFRTVTVGSLNRRDGGKLHEFIGKYATDARVQARAKKLIERVMDENSDDGNGNQRILPIFAYLAID